MTVANPTLQFGSKLLVKIESVKSDITDYTLTISNLVLGCLAADLILGPSCSNTCRSFFELLECAIA